MQKLLSLVLAAALVCSLAGCSLTEPEETRNAPVSPVLTEAPTTQPETEPPTETTEAPTEATEKDYPQRIGDAILIEGEPEKLMMELFDGGNYVIYIIEDMWTLETSLVDGYLTDRWVCSFNDMIDFQVISFGPKTPEEAEQYIREKKSGYTFQEAEPGVISGMDMQRSYFLSGEIHSDGKNTFAILTEFPMEAGDGFGGRTAKMMNTFEIK